MLNQKSFNFVIAQYWDKTKTHVGAYMWHNQIIFYGTYAEALEMANSVTTRNRKYKVFKLVEVNA